MLRAFLILLIWASPALAQDWGVMGRGTVTLGGQAERMWIPDHPGQGPMATIEGSGAAEMRFEAFPGPVGKAPMPKPSIQVRFSDPTGALGSPELQEVHYRDAEGINYLAQEGTIEARLTEGRWMVGFAATLRRLDPTTWEPVRGVEPLQARGSFDLEAAVR